MEAVVYHANRDWLDRLELWVPMWAVLPSSGVDRKLEAFVPDSPIPVGVSVRRIRYEHYGKLGITPYSNGHEMIRLSG